MSESVKMWSLTMGEKKVNFLLFSVVPLGLHLAPLGLHLASLGLHLAPLGFHLAALGVIWGGFGALWEGFGQLWGGESKKKREKESLSSPPNFSSSPIYKKNQTPDQPLLRPHITRLLVVK